MRRSSKPSALVFDFDGVVFDSKRLMQHALAESFRAHGGLGAPPEAAFFALMGKPLEEIVARLGLPGEMVATYRRVSREALHLAAPYAGIEDALRAAHDRGMRVGLMTGKDRDRTEEILARFELARWFDAIVCGDDPLPSKPAPDGLWSLLETLGASRLGSAMIGDSEIDVACALAAGVLPLGAAWGFVGASELTARGARTFADPKELTDWIRRGATMTNETPAYAYRERSRS